jgi:membrane protein involved in colicin uptake
VIGGLLVYKGLLPLFTGGTVAKGTATTGTTAADSGAAAGAARASTSTTMGAHVAGYTIIGKTTF